MNTEFIDTIQSGYQFEGESIILGGAMLDGQTHTGTLVSAPLKTFNRHGLIAGATGTGKTKSMQRIAEALSEKGVSCVLMDIKGDLSGISQPSSGHIKITERVESIGAEWSPSTYPVEFLQLENGDGVKIRSTITEFGPVMFSKMLDLNEVQSGVVSLIFKYADDHDLALIDMKDFKKTLQYITNEGKDQVQAQYGAVSSSSTGAILRQIIALEEQGGDIFFAEPSFEVDDLVHVNSEGKGRISVVRLMDMQSKPRLFSTCMLSLLAEVYQQYPEQGDADKPKLVIFIDEAHLLFDTASKALLDQIESIIKLIRSKGVGIFFVTQNPVDIPESVLAQLGFKLQHALRAFTAKDRKAIKLAAQNYPESSFYQVDSLLTELGIGEAFISVLNEKGIPTPLVHTMLYPPRSRMDIITADELTLTLAQSQLIAKYETVVDRESAYEKLHNKINSARNEEQNNNIPSHDTKKESNKSQNKKDSVLESVSKNTMVRQLGRVAMREVTRGILGVLGVKRR